MIGERVREGIDRVSMENWDNDGTYWQSSGQQEKV